MTVAERKELMGRYVNPTAKNLQSVVMLKDGVYNRFMKDKRISAADKYTMHEMLVFLNVARANADVHRTKAQEAAGAAAAKDGLYTGIKAAKT